MHARPRPVRPTPRSLPLTPPRLDMSQAASSSATASSAAGGGGDGAAMAWGVVRQLAVPQPPVSCVCALGQGLVLVGGVTRTTVYATPAPYSAPRPEYHPDNLEALLLGDTQARDTCT